MFQGCLSITTLPESKNFNPVAAPLFRKIGGGICLCQQGGKFHPFTLQTADAQAGGEGQWLRNFDISRLNLLNNNRLSQVGANALSRR
jgi:hypothetical protein